MTAKEQLIHLIKRLLLLAVPAAALLIWWKFIYDPNFYTADGIPHRTDSGFGVVILWFLMGITWGIYLIADMIRLYRRQQKPLAYINFYLLISLIVAAIVITFQLW